MTRALRPLTCALLVAALAAPASLASAADDRDTAASTPNLRASIDRAAAHAAAAAVPSRQIATQSPAPPAYPLTTKRDRSLKQGGNGGMMVMGIVGTLAGLAGTYYMIKMMKDNQKDVQTAP
jgi:hypothetical protein